MTDYSNIQDELLASLINYPNQIHYVNDIIGDRKIFDRNRDKIYQSILSLHSSGDQVDVVSVGAKSGIDIVNLMTLGTAYGATSYAKILVEKWLGKELKELGHYAAHASDKKDPFELSQELGDKLFRLESGMIQKGFLSSSEASEQAMKAVTEGFQGVTTGYRCLDEILGGWGNSDLIIIAGRPGEGKSSLGICSAIRTAKSGIGVGIFTLEMSTPQLQIRVLGNEAKVDTFRLRIGRIDDEEYRRVEEAKKYINSLPIYYDDTAGISALSIKAKARRLIREKGVGLILVDYLQLVAGNKEGNREQEISSISRTLKMTAKELGVPVIALSQMNRLSEGRANKRPILSDLRESGAIEQDSDVVIFIYQKEELIIAKHRNGSTGDCPVTFVKQFASFEER